MKKVLILSIIAGALFTSCKEAKEVKAKAIESTEIVSKTKEEQKELEQKIDNASKELDALLKDL